MEEKEKTGPSDNPYPQRGDDELSEEENKIKKGIEKDKAYNKALKESEEAGEQAEERRKEGLKQYEKKDVDTKKQIREEEGEMKIGGQKVKPKKTYSHDKGEEGIFKRGKVTNYSQKINKVLTRKVQGVSSEKKKAIAELIDSGAKRKTVLRKKEIDVIFRGLKHKNFSSAVFKGIFEKMEERGINPKDCRKELKKMFNKRDIGKFERAIGGGEDPRKHKLRPSSNRNPGAGRPGSTSPSRIRKG